ncbi:MAG TPA: dTDP-4-dehydrorhamnose 3,5-epimerase [Verrucomicrobiae bacterium]|nr:dTDP-4-dehydrorhamnose 3,5-epimerase [Verrucomicrobiae bacterium]
MKIKSEPLPAALVLEPNVFEDKRGNFVKTFQKPAFSTLKINFHPQEEFYSTSNRDVLRGMHFQLPPHDHDKLVYCIRGAVLDVILDIRKNSPAFGRSAAVELTAQNHLLFFIPKGFAHGFLSLEDETVMIYKTSTVHAPSHDAGIRWDSFGFQWPVKKPILSDRDNSFPALADFRSPF